MAGHSPVLCLGGALRDHHLVDDAAPALALAVRFALGAPRTQAAGQLTAQFTSALDEKGLVNGLVAHLHHRIVGEGAAQTPAISSGDQNSSSQPATKAQRGGCESLAALGRRARTQAPWCASQAR